MQPINRNHVVAFSRPPPRSGSARLRPPSEFHQVIFKDHCKYELRRTSAGTTIIATPLSKAAQQWLAGQKTEELRLACNDGQAGAYVRGIEAAIDTAPR